MKATSPRSRILTESKNLFYTQGFHNTGINQILRQSKTAKASFYDHFPSKEHLGKLIIRQYAAEIQLWFRKIMNQSTSPFDFVKNLSKAIELQINSKENLYQGCPIAIFSCQFPINEPVFHDEFKKSIQRWEKMFVQFWNRPQIGSLLKPNTDRILLTRDLINLYEGALINWRISKNESYIARMEINMHKRISEDLS